MQHIYGEMSAKRIQILVITDGKNGAYIFLPDGDVIHVITPVEKIVSSAGSGDTFLAALLLALGRGEGLEKAVGFASAAAAANLLELGCGFFDPEKVHRPDFRDKDCTQSLELTQSNLASLVMAVDIGGTQIKAGIIDSSGEILSLQRANTPVNSDPEDVVQRLIQILKRLMSGSPTIQTEKFARYGHFHGCLYHLRMDISQLLPICQRQWIGYDLKSRLEQSLNYHITSHWIPQPPLWEKPIMAQVKVLTILSILQFPPGSALASSLTGDIGLVDRDGPVGLATPSSMRTARVLSWLRESWLPGNICRQARHSVDRVGYGPGTP